MSSKGILQLIIVFALIIAIVKLLPDNPLSLTVNYLKNLFKGKH